MSSVWPLGPCSKTRLKKKNSAHTINSSAGGEAASVTNAAPPPTATSQPPPALPLAGRKTHPATYPHAHPHNSFALLRPCKIHCIRVNLLLP